MVDRVGLETRYTRKGIEGSNPSLSASQTEKRYFQLIERIGFIAQFCTALHTLELDLLHNLLHISLHKVR